MTTILRSLKYTKYFSSLSRQFINHHRTPDYYKLNLGPSSHTLVFNRLNLTSAKELRTSKNDVTDLLNNIDHQVRVLGSVQKEHVLKLIKALEVAGHLEGFQAILLIRCISFLYEIPQNERIQMTQHIWDTLIACDIPMDVSHYNALLSVHCDNNYDFSPLEFLSEMQKKGIIPNRVTYERLLKYYCQQGNIAGVTKIMEQMKEENIPLTENTFNNLILGHSKAGDLESAVKVLDLMKQANIEPSAETYAMLMGAYAKEGDIESIKRVLSDCESKEISISNRHILDLIYVLSENNHLDKVNEMLPLLSPKAEFPADELVIMSKLIEIGQENVALKIFKSLPTLSRKSSAKFLLRKIMTTIESKETILQLVKMFEQILESSEISLNALKQSYLKRDDSLSLTIMKMCKEAGIEIRTHYFWPLLARNAQNHNYQGLLNVIQSMVKEFNVMPCMETLARYVLPYSVGSIEEVLKSLEECGIPPSTLDASMLYYLLETGKIRQAAKFIGRSSMTFDGRLYLRPLERAFLKTHDIESYATIISLLRSEDKKHWIVDSLPVEDLPTITNIIRYFNDYGIKMSRPLIDQIKTNLDDVELQNMVDRLAVDENKLQSSYRFWNEYNMKRPETEDTLISKIQNASTQGLPTKKLQIQLLFFYIENKNPEKTIEMLKIISQEDIYFHEAMYHKIIHFFYNMGLLDKAETYLQEYKSKYPTSSLYPDQVIRYATLLAKLNKLKDALKFLQSELKPEETIQSERTIRIRYHQLCVTLLNVFAEQENEELLETCFQTLLERRVMLPTTLTTSPFVKQHFDRKDLQAALKKLLWVYEKYNTLPLKSQITKEFIKLEDAKSLQTLLDCSTRKWGETAALIQLVFDLLECDRTRQAKKILETTQLTFRTISWSRSIKRLTDPKVLESLVEVTRNINSVPKFEIYQQLLDIYVLNNDWNKGLELWTKMQDNDVLPDERFLSILANLLETNHQNVPFVYGKSSKNHSTSSPNTFEEAIESGNLQDAENMLKRIDSNDEKLIDYCNSLITQYLKKENINEAVEIAKFGLSKNPKLSETQVFKELLETLEHNGAIETLEDFQRMSQKS